MSPYRVLAVASAELRTLRNQARTWLLWLVVVGIGVAAFAFLSLSHSQKSGASLAFGAVNARFLVHGIGVLALWTSLVGVVFLAFDVVAGDDRDGVGDVLGVRPVDNLELLCGRLAAVVLMAWLPLLLFVVLTYVATVAADGMGWPLGAPFEPLSLLAFLLADSPPALLVWGAGTVLLAVTLRNRPAVAVVVLAALASQFWALFNAPRYLLPTMSSVGQVGLLASDVLPRFADQSTLFQRLCLLCLAAGLLLAAAAFHRRRDGASLVYRAVGATVAALLGLAGLAYLGLQAHAKVAERDGWAAAHQARRNEPRADLLRIAGRVQIEPQLRTLAVDVRLRLRPPTDDAKSLVLSFNPGMDVERVCVGDVVAQHRHEDGFLAVQLPAPTSATGTVEVAVQARGVPDSRFAYFDSAIDAQKASFGDSLLHLLGVEAALFDERYVALMPAVRWLPRPGANYAPDHCAQACRDFFAIDLEVEVPQEWIVAGPGLRLNALDSPVDRLADSTACVTDVQMPRSGSDRYRFRSAAQVPAVALFASRFERRTAEVAGVQLELLLHRRHVRNVDGFGGAGAFVDGLEAMLLAAKRPGLEYPYRNLSIVETPGRLRTYGGSWRMDSVQALPGLLLLREYGFPSATLEHRPANDEGSASRRAFWRYFAHDLGGGDMMHLSRNLFRFQTAPRGEGAAALDFALQNLVDEALSIWARPSRQTPFSAHSFTAQNAALPPLGAAFAAMLGNTDAVFSATRRSDIEHWVSSGPGREPLVRLRPHEAPVEALHRLALSARGLASLTVDLVGRQGTAAFLATLRHRHAGSSFTTDDVADIAVASGMPPGLFDAWLHQTSLPGYLTSPPQVFRLTDDEQGRPRYQIKVQLRNAESAPGFVQLSHTGTIWDPDFPLFVAPVRVDGHTSVEIGMLSRGPPKAVVVDTYLSQNGGLLHLPLPDINTTDAVVVEPLIGGRASAWQPRPSSSVVVDDLDTGFQIERLPSRSWLGGSHPASRSSGGWIVSSAKPARMGALGGTWMRTSSRWGWGKYRRTITRARPGTGLTRAAFTANLPANGRWRLEYHVPGTESHAGLAGATPMPGQGSYEVAIVASGSEVIVGFDASIANRGWSHVGDYQLNAGRVIVRVSDRSSGEVVVADAIRWSPLDSADVLYFSH